MYMIAHLIGIILLYTVQKATAYATVKVMAAADKVIETAVDKTLDEIKIVAAKTATSVTDKTIKYINNESEKQSDIPHNGEKSQMIDADTQTGDETDDYSRHQIDDFIINPS